MHAGQELYQLNYIPASSILNVSRLLRILGVGKNKKKTLGLSPYKVFNLMRKTGLTQLNG